MGVVCQILINRPIEGVHRAGGEVTGTVKYAIDQPTEYKDIVLSLKGDSFCSWSESRANSSTSTNYTGTSEHVNQVISLVDAMGGIRTLPTGDYAYKFIFTLPRLIPPSFKQRTGYVAYKLLMDFKKQGIFNKTNKFSADIIVRNFLVPTLPNYPIVFGVDKTLLKPLSDGNQKVSLKAEVASPYIRPGEKAELKFMVTNDSNVRIESIKAKLIRTTLYTANCGRKNILKKILKKCMVKTEEVRPYYTTNMNVTVPTLAKEWTVQNSKVISNEYKILVTVRLPVPHRTVSAEMPVLLGDREEDIQVIEEGTDIVKSIYANTHRSRYWEDRNEWIDYYTELLQRKYEFK